jgi:septum formation protein
MPRLILASASPRRRELLAQAGFTFEVQAAHINEDPRPGEDPIAYVVRLARNKAEHVRSQISSSKQSSGAPPIRRSLPDGWESNEPGPDRNPGAPGLASESGDSPNIDVHSIVVLGADTTVTLDGHILAKPEDAADAARMLRMLSGRTHRVVTGVAVATASGTQVAAEVTGVQFLTLSDEEIAAYIATGEPMDKAGAYGIQGYAGKWIPRVEGCYFNVVGLPLALVSTMLESVGH